MSRAARNVSGQGDKVSRCSADEANAEILNGPAHPGRETGIRIRTATSYNRIRLSMAKPRFIISAPPVDIAANTPASRL